ncbi:MAG TPA: alpha/beta fold hydrolase [Acidimicrobiales bacterium]|nr:alpha/beta fold hydrolase [Acidimicrobiales bacterium]
MPVVVLIHSPLVGPSSWHRVAEELNNRGREATVPDLRGAAEKQATIAAIADSAARQIPDSELVLVGHSGAGMLLPAIAHRVSTPVTAFCFVDAHLPPRKGEVPLADPAFFGFLSSISSQGRLPPWSSWWGPETMEALVPDPAVRAQLTEEMPSLSLDYFLQEIHAVERWPATCGYVRLSASYEPSASEAEELGWPVERFSAGHLHGVVDPASVAAAVLDVLEVSSASRSQKRR